MFFFILYFVTSLSYSLPLEKESSSNQCLQCHGNMAIKSIHAPKLPSQFSMKWDMFEFVSEQRPPFNKIPQPNKILKGATYYDWSQQSMTEIYYDKCIDIFPHGRDYACQFTSIKDQTFLIKFIDHDLKKPEACCLWSHEPFWAPRPDVISNMVFKKSVPIENEKIKYWILDIPLPGPFGFGFYEDKNIPAFFWFPVISGWVQQNFKNIRIEPPDKRFFELPELCQKKLSLCEKT